MERRVHKGMSSNAQHWCKYCRTYVYNNKVSMKKHEESIPHKTAVKRFIETASKEVDEQAALKREFSQRTGITLGSVASKGSQESEKSVKSFYASVPAVKAVKTKETIKDKKTVPRPAPDSLPWRRVIVEPSKGPDDLDADPS